jgi:hypothetical protein
LSDVPRDLQTFTNCAGPDRAISHDRLGLRAPIISAFINSWESGVVGAVVAVGWLIGAVFITTIALIAAVPGGGGPIAAAVWVFWIITELGIVNTWYYNWRLLCIAEDDQCLIGTVLSEPSVSTWDGDRKLNLVAAPFIRDEHIEMLVVHLDANRDLLTQPSLPDFPPPGFNVANPLDTDVASLGRYFDALGEADAELSEQIQIGTVDRLMSDDNTSAIFPGEPKNFFSRFYRKDPAFIAEGSDLWNAIGDDNDPSVDWEQPNQRSSRSLNPMFRFESKDGAFYVHCEIEGDRFSDIIYAVQNGLFAFLAALLIVAAAFGWIWGAVAGLAALLAVTGLSYVIGEALWGSAPEKPDIDWDDEDADQDGVADQRGDVVVVRGRWIMDTEHERYFEIHPVRAYYLVARTNLDEPEVVEPDRAVDTFDPRLINGARAENICAMVDPSEQEDPVDVVEITVSQGLSWGLQTPYSGGGLRAT